MRSEPQPGFYIFQFQVLKCEAAVTLSTKNIDWNHINPLGQTARFRIFSVFDEIFYWYSEETVHIMHGKILC